MSKAILEKLKQADKFSGLKRDKARFEALKEYLPNTLTFNDGIAIIAYTGTEATYAGALASNIMHCATAEQLYDAMANTYSIL